MRRSLDQWREGTTGCACAVVPDLGLACARRLATVGVGFGVAVGALGRARKFATEPFWLAGGKWGNAGRGANGAADGGGLDERWAGAEDGEALHVITRPYLASDMGTLGLAGLTSTSCRAGRTTRSMSSMGMAPMSGSSSMIMAPVKQRRFLKRISTGPQ